MNVMLIEPLGDGGIAHYTLNLAEALAQRKSNVILFTSKKYEFNGRTGDVYVYPHMFKWANYLTVFFPWIARETGIPLFLRRFIKLLEYPFNTIEALSTAKKHTIDIAHFQSVNEVELFMIIAFKLIGIKVIFTIHNVRPRHGRLKFYHAVIYRFLYSLCNHLIIHSQSGKTEVEELFSVYPGKISVIPHGDYKFFVPENSLAKDNAKTALGIAITCKTILFFGAIRPNKGLDNLLYALPQIKRNISNIKLLIIGEPYESYTRYKSIIEHQNIMDEVFEKLDYIAHHEVALYFSATDVVVLPYNEITQSGVLQIAYAFGKPVVASAIGGFNESVENNKNGYLVPPRDINALAKIIANLLSDENKMEEMGKYSRYLSDTKYSWDSIAQQTLQVYSHCV